MFADPSRGGGDGVVDTGRHDLLNKDLPSKRGIYMLMRGWAHYGAKECHRKGDGSNIEDCTNIGAGPLFEHPRVYALKDTQGLDPINRKANSRMRFGALQQRGHHILVLIHSLPYGEISLKDKPI